MPHPFQPNFPIPRRPVPLACLVSIGLLPFFLLPLNSHEAVAVAAGGDLGQQEHTWFPTPYRPWNQTSAWQPTNSQVFWNRPSCGANQTCLPLKVLTRDDCQVLSVSATLIQPSTGQTLFAHDQRQKVMAGQETQLTLRWNLPPSQFNPTLALETKLKGNIETLGERRLNPNLQELAVAHLRSRLFPQPPPWQAVSLHEIRCL
jgi:hypothetical protein